MPRTAAPGTRERILRTAARLFYAHGVQAVGTQQVITAAGTGKNLLYQHFPTKDDLVAAYLDHVRGWRSAAAEQARDAAGDDPGDQLIAIVAEVGEHLRGPGFRGCAFRNYLLENPDTTAAAPSGPGAIAHQYLSATRSTIDDLAARLVGHVSPRPEAGVALAEQLWLLVDGLYLQAGYRLPDDLDRGITAATDLARARVDAAR